MKIRLLLKTNQRRTLASLCFGACLAASLATTSAADKTWDGGGDQSSWSASPDNWDLNTAPVANDSLFFDGAVGLFTFNDFPADTDFAGITFNAGASSFTLTGAEVDLIGGVTNLSANLQTISHNLDQPASRTHHAVGDLLYDGAVKNNILIKYGPGTITLGGALDNSSLRTEVNEGVVVLAKSANRSLGSSPIVARGTGTLRIAGPATDQIHFNQRVVITNGGVLQVQNTFEEIGSLSGSTDSAGIVENGLAATICRLDIGGGSGHEGIYSGTIRDGDGVLNLRVYRHDNKYVFNGTHTYTGTTEVNNTSGSGTTRMILNGTHTGGGDYTVNGHATTADRLAVLGGSGSVSATVVNFNIRGILSPGGALSADLTDSATFSETTAILTINNAVNLNDATTTLDVQLNGTTAGSGYDQVNIAGSGSLSNNNANLKLTLGYTPNTGDKFTIVQVQGTDSANNFGVFAALNGVVTDLTQGATFIEPSSGKSIRISYRAEGTTFDAGAGLGNDIMLEVLPDSGGQLTWRGDLNNLWDIGTANWRDAGNTAVAFASGDNVTFNDAGSNSAPVDLATDLSPANILVNASKDYVWATSGAGKLTGTIVTTKTNTGKVTILTDNDNAGSTLVRQGTIQVGTNGTSGMLSGLVNISSNGTVIFNRSDAAVFAGTLAGNGQVVQNGTNGTLILTGNNTFTGGTLVNAGTLQFGDGTSANGSIAGTVTNHTTVTYSYNNAAVINNSLSGAGEVNLINSDVASRRFTLGAGATSLTNNTFSGTFNVGPLVNLATPDGSNGTNQLGVGSTVIVQDTGALYLDRFGYYVSTILLQGSGNGAGGIPNVALEVEQGTTVAGNIILLADATIGGFLGTVNYTGRIVGTNGTETLTFANRRANAQSYNLQLGSQAGPNHWGATIIEPGDNLNQLIRVTAIAPRAISTNALTIGAHGIFQLNGFDHTVATISTLGMDGAFVPSVFNGSAGTPAVFTVGTDNSSPFFDGVFGDGGAAPLGVTKVGTGTLMLSGVSTNSGAVRVNGGTIQLIEPAAFPNASLIAAGSGATFDVTGRSDQALTLNSGQTLGGSGTVNGNVVTLAGAAIAPGDSVGILTVANNITLGGGMVMELNRSLSPNSDRLISTSGTITGGGTLTTTNIGPALQVGDTFQLFAAGVSGITANLQTVDALNGVAYTWQNNISSSGSISVLSVTTISAPTLGVSQSGNTLTFTWAGPFKLLAQTNSLSVGLSSNWGDYPGGGSSGVNVTIDPASPTVFFRLGLQ